MSAPCPNCGSPVKTTEKGNCSNQGCGCLLVTLSIFVSLFLFPIGPIIGVVFFGMGLWIILTSKKETTPSCTNCNWEGK